MSSAIHSSSYNSVVPFLSRRTKLALPTVCCYWLLRLHVYWTALQDALQALSHRSGGRTKEIPSPSKPDHNVVLNYLLLLILLPDRYAANVGGVAPVTLPASR